MKIKIIAALLVIACISVKDSFTFAQEKPENITENFFKLFQEKGSDEAFDYIFGTNKWLNKQLQENNKTKVKEILPMMGQYYGYELIEKKIVSDSYVVMIFMVKYDRQPVKFTFSLYKPKDNWQMIDFKSVDFRFQEEEQEKKN